MSDTIPTNVFACIYSYLPKATQLEYLCLNKQLYKIALPILYGELVLEDQQQVNLLFSSLQRSAEKERDPKKNPVGHHVWKVHLTAGLCLSRTSMEKFQELCPFVKDFDYLYEKRLDWLVQHQYHHGWRHLKRNVVLDFCSSKFTYINDEKVASQVQHAILLADHPLVMGLFKHISSHMIGLRFLEAYTMEDYRLSVSDLELIHKFCPSLERLELDNRKGLDEQCEFSEDRLMVEPTVRSLKVTFDLTSASCNWLAYFGLKYPELESLYLTVHGLPSSTSKDIVEAAKTSLETNIINYRNLTKLRVQVKGRYPTEETILDPAFLFKQLRANGSRLQELSLNQWGDQHTTSAQFLSLKECALSFGGTLQKLCLHINAETWQLDTMFKDIIDALAQCPHLKSLQLDTNTKFTSVDVKEPLANRMLKVDAPLQLCSLLETCKQLEEVTLVGAVVTKGQFNSEAPPKHKLQTLRLVQCAWTPDTFDAIEAQCPNFTNIHISGQLRPRVEGINTLMTVDMPTLTLSSLEIGRIFIDTGADTSSLAATKLRLVESNSTEQWLDMIDDSSDGGRFDMMRRVKTETERDNDSQHHILVRCKSAIQVRFDHRLEVDWPTFTFHDMLLSYRKTNVLPDME